MCSTQHTMEESVNMSTMGNGGNSPTMRSAKACNTETMRRTTGSPTTTIPTDLWYYEIALYCGMLLHFRPLHRDVFCHHFFDLFQAEATSEGSEEYYDDAADFLKARKTSSSSNAGVTFGIYYVEVGLSGSREREFLQNITQHRSQVGSTDLQTHLFCHKHDHTFMFFFILSYFHLCL